MSSDDDDDGVKLYSSLERNRKRQTFVTLSSSESESDHDSLYEESPLVRKRRRQSLMDHSTSPDQTNVARVVDMAADVDDVEQLLTPTEREAARRMAMQIEYEIAQRMEHDALLNQTRAIMNKTTSTQRQIVSLDSDSESDSDVELIAPPGASTQQLQQQTPMQQQQQTDKGERIVLRIRSNGDRIDDVAIHRREPFDVLYQSFCDLVGLPRAAVHMTLDGAALALTATPQALDLEASDLIDARVDFLQQRDAARKTFVRLRLAVDGRRSEVFKIDAMHTIDKLRASFCHKHAIVDVDAVQLSALGATLALDATIESYGLRDDDAIVVTLPMTTDDAQILSVTLRFPDGACESHSVKPHDRVESLVQLVARQRHTQPTNVSLRLDGDAMGGSQTFDHYELEGGELLEVKIAS